MAGHPIDQDGAREADIAADVSRFETEIAEGVDEPALMAEYRAMPENDGDSEQLALPLMSVVQTPEQDDPEATIQERFEAFHAANRWIFYSFVSLTEDWLAQGNTRASIGMFTEVLRHRYGRIIKGQTFKINNNYRSRYVRKLIEERPEWGTVFETRELRSK